MRLAALYQRQFGTDQAPFAEIKIIYTRPFGLRNKSAQNGESGSLHTRS
jgi:hypothetical protein